MSVAPIVDRLRRDPGLAFVLCALVLATALYAPTIGRGLVNYDDPWLIRDNWIVQHPSWSSLHTIWFDLDSPRRFTLSSEYLPVRDLSIMLDFAIWGDWYAGFHITNLVLYLASITLWFGVLVGFGVDRRVAGLAVLVWALHPSHAESVAWLAERKGLLGVTFAGAAGLCYAKFRAGCSAGWLALAMLAAVTAVWSKAPAAFAIAALAGLELALPVHRKSRLRSMVGIGAIGIVSVAAFVPVLVVATSFSVVGTSANVPAGRIAMVFGIHGFYVRAAAMAVSNAASYPLSTDGPSVIDIAIGLVGLVTFVLTAIVPRRLTWSPPDELRAAAVLWVVCWLPVSHLILPLQNFVADRYLLLPTLGLGLAVAVGITRIPSARARRALIGVVVVAAGMRTFDAQSNWRTSTTLWERAVRSSPDDGTAWSMYAEALAEDGQPTAAAEAVQNGLKHGRAPRLLLREALLVLQQDRHQGIEAMRQAAEAGEPRAMSNLGLLLLEDGKLDDALAWARRGAAAMPLYAAGHRTHGKVALAAHHPDQAFEAFTRAFELEPTNLANRYNLALALIELHRPDEARVHLEACLQDRSLGARARAALTELDYRR